MMRSLWIALVLLFLPSTLGIPCAGPLRNAQVTRTPTTPEYVALLNLDYDLGGFSLAHLVSHSYATFRSAFWFQLFQALHSRLQRIIFPSRTRSFLDEDCSTNVETNDPEEKVLCRLGNPRLQQEPDIWPGHRGDALNATLPLRQTSASGNDHEKRLVHPAQPACIGNCRLRHVLNFSGSGSGAPEVLQIAVHLEAITLKSGPITLSAPPPNAVLLDPSVPWIIVPRSLAAEFFSRIPHAVLRDTGLGLGDNSTPYSLPCTTTLGISFQFTGTNLSISAQALMMSEDQQGTLSGMCNSNIHAWVDPNIDSYVLGSPFTHSVYLTSTPNVLTGRRFQLNKRHGSVSKDAHWRGVIIGATIGGVAGAACLAFGVYQLLRIRRKRNSIPPSAEFYQSTELQPPRARSGGTRQLPHPIPAPAPVRAHSPVAPVAFPVDIATRVAPASVHTRRASYTPSPLRFQAAPYASESRASTGSQFMEHFGDAPTDSQRGGTSRARSPLIDKPLPRVPQDPAIPESPREGSVRTVQLQEGAPQLELTFSPFDASGLIRSASQSGGHSRTTTHSLPPGAASPVSSVGGYKPAEQSPSTEVQTRPSGRRAKSEV